MFSPFIHHRNHQLSSTCHYLSINPGMVEDFMWLELMAIAIACGQHKIDSGYLITRSRKNRLKIFICLLIQIANAPVSSPALQENTWSSLPNLLTPLEHTALCLQTSFSRPIALSQPTTSASTPWEPTAHFDQGSKWADCRSSPFPPFLQVQNRSLITSSVADYLL